jgi:hypothetical protein
MSLVGGRAGLGTISTVLWEGGLLTVEGTRVKEAWGLYPGSVGVGGSGNMARVCGRIGLGTLTKDQFVCRFGNVGKACAKEGLETISRAWWEGGSWKMARAEERAELGTISMTVWLGGLGTV